MKTSQRFCRITVVSLLLSSSAVSGAEPETNAAPSPRERNLETVRTSYTSNSAKYAGNPDFLVKPGLLANRKDRWVKVDAEKGIVEVTKKK